MPCSQSRNVEEESWYRVENSSWVSDRARRIIFACGVRFIRAHVGVSQWLSIRIEKGRLMAFFIRHGVESRLQSMFWGFGRA